MNEIVQNLEMIDAGTRIVCRRKLSGFIGFDFMIEDAISHAHLVTMNLCTTQITGLVPEAALDPIAACRKAIVDAPTTPGHSLDRRTHSLARTAAVTRLSSTASRQQDCWA